MPKKLSHEECRRKVCASCGEKADRILSEDKAHLIVQFRCHSYNIQDPRFPLGICSNCRLILSKWENGDKSKSLPPPPDFESEELAVITRNSGNDCSCSICLIARKTGPKTKDKSKLGRHSLPPPPQFQSCSVCCFQYPVEDVHNCSGIVEAPKNIAKMVENLDISQKDKLISNLLKNKISEEGIRKGGEISLTTGGRKLPISVGQKRTKDSREFTLPLLDQLQTKHNFSGSQMKSITSAMRVGAGRNALPSNLEEHFSDRSHLLDDIYHVQKLSLKISNGKIENRDVVLCNLEDLINKANSFRGNDKLRTLVKIMVDRGDNLLKIDLSLITEDKDDPLNSPVKKGTKSRYSDVASGAAADWKESGTKKLLIAAAVPDAVEDYDNLELLFKELRTDRVKFMFVGDFKIIYIILGLQGQNAKHPCFVCDIDKDHLNERGSFRTFGSLQENYRNWVSSGADKKNAMDYKNVVHMPLLHESPETRVIDVLGVPTLHLLLGSANHMYSGLSDIWGIENARYWAKKCGISSAAYHGKMFEGNNCRKLLKGSDLLDTLSDNVIVKKYVAAFRSLNLLVHESFGSRYNPHYERLISNFRDKYLDLGISITPKMHYIFFHISDFLKDHPEGLAKYCEQTGESVHHDFKEVWASHKINDTTSPKFAENFLAAVVEYSSKRL